MSSFKLSSMPHARQLDSYKAKSLLKILPRIGEGDRNEKLNRPKETRLSPVQGTFLAIVILREGNIEISHKDNLFVSTYLLLQSVRFFFITLSFSNGACFVYANSSF